MFLRRNRLDLVFMRRYDGAITTRDSLERSADGA